MNETPHSPAIMRSMLGRARGLGSAKSGTAHWWAQRVTALALIPLTLWFIWSILHLAGLPRAAVVLWASSPFVATLLVALILTTFHHMQLGLQVVIEDYIHGEKLKLATVMANNFFSFAVALASIYAILKLSSGV